MKPQLVSRFLLLLLSIFFAWAPVAFSGERFKIRLCGEMLAVAKGDDSESRLNELNDLIMQVGARLLPLDMDLKENIEMSVQEVGFNLGTDMSALNKALDDEDSHAAGEVEGVFSDVRDLFEGPEASASKELVTVYQYLGFETVMKHILETGIVDVGLGLSLKQYMSQNPTPISLSEDARLLADLSFERTLVLKIVNENWDSSIRQSVIGLAEKPFSNEEKMTILRSYFEYMIGTHYKLFLRPFGEGVVALRIDTTTSNPRLSTMSHVELSMDPIVDQLATGYGDLRPEIQQLISRDVFDLWLLLKFASRPSPANAIVN